MILENPPLVLWVQSSSEGEIQTHSSDAHFKVIRVESVEEAIKILEESNRVVDLLVLDLDHSKEHCEKIFEIAKGTIALDLPVVAITRWEQLNDQLGAFAYWLDDYLIKPIDSREVQARINMRIKKKLGHQKHAGFKAGPFIFQTNLGRVFVRTGKAEELISLTRTEFKLFLCLAQQQNQVFTRAQLMSVIWGNDVVVLDRTVDAHICAIRRKLKFLAHMIQSIPGIGYRFYVSEEGSHDYKPRFNSFGTPDPSGGIPLG